MKRPEIKEKKIISPEGEEFEVDYETTFRFLNQGVSLALGEVKEGRLSIKEGECFLYTNLEGDIPIVNRGGFGFYYRDTRFLSAYELRVAGSHPVLLHSTAERNYLGHVEGTNVEINYDGILIPQHTINIRRLRAIKRVLYERLRLKNYNSFIVKVPLEFEFGADFADIFEVRGLKRKRRGTYLKPKVCPGGIIFAYMGEDEVFRQLRIKWGQEPKSIIFTPETVKVFFEIEIGPQGRFLLDLSFEPSIGGVRRKIKSFNEVVAHLRRSYLEWERNSVRLTTDNQLFNIVLEKASNDLRQLYTPTYMGEIIYAGIPWFAAPFGRDSLISALQALPFKPSLAKGTLSFCARFQGKEFNPERDEEPGKIFHEIRQGELANLRQIPQTPYYGSVDSTPLFLILASEYLKWTGDENFIKSIMSNILLAFEWLEKFGDVDKDGLIEYQCRSKKGLFNQGWKDSWDAIIEDGKQPQPPIALVEVQGYAYKAYLSWSNWFNRWGDKEKAKKLEGKAEEIRKKFEEFFWQEERNFYALALDGNKRPIKTVTSNPGHCLWAEIVSQERAFWIARRLLLPDMFSGWGIRTVSKAERVYNPMGYHTGTVWPHDNSLIIAGLKKYGFEDEAVVVANGLYEMVSRHPQLRFPELFCGFTRRGNNYPVSYPVACLPQAWAAGSVFMILFSLLGLEAYASKNLLVIRPTLPPWLNWVKISNLGVGENKVDLMVRREGNSIKVEELEVEGSLFIIKEVKE